MYRRIKIFGCRLRPGARSGSLWAWAGRRFRNAALVTGALLGTGFPCWAYSLLTHEEIVDILWSDQLQPILTNRYPKHTSEQLREAHAYAYGGCLIQDMGYYPLGSTFFSDLAHYVRTGDLVTNLFHTAGGIDEYAFALGALIHYASDNTGHPVVNRAVARCFPKLRAKYGDSVTYEDDPRAHIRTEFGFDITQVAKHRYTSDTYHDFIGFQVSKPALERAILKTYGLPPEDVIGNVGLAIGTFRHAAAGVIPELTRAALTAYHPENVRDNHDTAERVFLHNISRASYEKEWGRQYRKPGFFARVLGMIVRITPKVGVFSDLSFVLPTPETDDLYFRSVNQTVKTCHKLLGDLQQGNLRLPNTDLDTGRPTAMGEYALCDNTYASLLDLLVKRNLADVSPALRENILAYYESGPPPLRTHKERRAWRRTKLELEALRAGPNSPIAEAIVQRLFPPLRRVESPKGKDTWG